MKHGLAAGFAMLHSPIWNSDWGPADPARNPLE
jgi:hypothetical protein